MAQGRLDVVVAHFIEDLFEVGHRLAGALDQVSDVVVLMFLEQREKEVHDAVLVIPSHLALTLLGLLVS